MLRRIDSSERLSIRLAQLSASSARLRGLPLLIGSGLLLLSFLSFALVILSLVISDNAASGWLWLCLPVGLLHLSLLIFFAGVMLAVPLGEGYRDTD
jgi:ABC-type polysaccharide/polyol phosphate export permease